MSSARQAEVAAAIARLRQQAAAVGYAVHQDASGSWRWTKWTLTRHGWSGIAASPWATEDAAWGDAIVAHASELMEP